MMVSIFTRWEFAFDVDGGLFAAGVEMAPDNGAMLEQRVR
jgi:hypothetical protein